MVSKKIFATTVLSYMAITLLAGCAAYKARPLPKLSEYTSSLFLDNKSISFAYHVLDKSECKKYLDRDVLSKGYQPVHITIVNNSKNTVQFSRKGISIPTVDAQEVAQKVHTNTVGRAVGYGTAAVLSCGFFAIPAIVDGIGSAKSNDQLDIDFEKKCLRDQEIEPNEYIDGLIFVPVETFKPNFKIALSDRKTSQKFVFNTVNVSDNKVIA